MLIIERYKEGKPILDICDEFEVSRGTVLRLARAAGLARRPKRRVPEEIRAIVVEELERGDMYKEIAARYDVSESWVHLIEGSWSNAL